MRTLGSLILFAVIFSFTTLSHHGGALGLGQSTFTAYGWPHPWLHVHNRDTRNSGNGRAGGIESRQGRQSPSRSLGYA
jgi:hypothetical protein